MEARRMTMGISLAVIIVFVMTSFAPATGVLAKGVRNPLFDKASYYLGDTMTITATYRASSTVYDIFRLLDPNGIIKINTKVFVTTVFTYVLLASDKTGDWIAQLTSFSGGKKTSVATTTGGFAIVTTWAASDSDGDGMSNGYEQSCSQLGSWQDPAEYNGRYAFLIYTDPLQLTTQSSLAQYQDLVNSIYDDLIGHGWNSANICYLGHMDPALPNSRLDGDATHANIVAQFNWLITHVASHDFFFLFWVGHGVATGARVGPIGTLLTPFGFYIRDTSGNDLLQPGPPDGTGEYATWDEVGLWVNQIFPKRMALCFQPCYSEEVLPWIGISNYVPKIVLTSNDNTTDNGWGEVFRNGLLGLGDTTISPNGHGNNDGYTTFDEAFYYAAMIAQGFIWPQHPRIDDLMWGGYGHIGSTIYDATYNPSSSTSDGYLAAHTVFP